MIYFQDLNKKEIEIEAIINDWEKRLCPECHSKLICSFCSKCEVYLTDKKYLKKIQSIIKVKIK